MVGLSLSPLGLYTSQVGLGPGLVNMLRYNAVCPGQFRGGAAWPFSIFLPDQLQHHPMAQFLMNRYILMGHLPWPPSWCRGRVQRFCSSDRPGVQKCRQECTTQFRGGTACRFSMFLSDQLQSNSQAQSNTESDEYVHCDESSPFVTSAMPKLF